MMRFKQWLKKHHREFYARIYARYADEIMISDDNKLELLQESKWISARFEDDIRIDRNKHLLSGDRHAHIYDRKGNVVGVCWCLLVS